MRIRRVDRELEAKLNGIAGSPHAGASGKLERKSYRGGLERLKIRLRGIAAGGGAASVVVAGAAIAELAVESGSARYDAEFTVGSDVPVLDTGQAVEVLVNGELALSGTLLED